MRVATRLTAILTAMALVGCQSNGSVLDSKAKKGALLGTLAGAVAGAAIGGHEHRAGGALIGAATGAIAGGLVGRYLDQQAAELDAIPGAEVQKRDDSILVNFQGGLLFDSGSSTLQPGGYDRLRSLARTLNNYPKSRVIIKGHTDNVEGNTYNGSSGDNQRLSEERSDRVRNFLIAQGVHPTRITAIGFGESMPLASNTTEVGRGQNRRVEIEIRPEQEVLRERPVQ